MSNQYVPFAGVPAGTVAEPVRSAKSTLARTTYALFEIPKYEYAANKPYSFLSSPGIIVEPAE